MPSMVKVPFEAWNFALLDWEWTAEKTRRSTDGELLWPTLSTVLMV